MTLSDWFPGYSSMVQEGSSPRIFVLAVSSLLPPGPSDTANSAASNHHSNVNFSVCPTLVILLKTVRCHPLQCHSLAQLYIFCHVSSSYYLLMNVMTAFFFYAYCLLSVLLLLPRPIQGKDFFCLFFFTGVSQVIEQCLAHKRYSINIFWMNEWTGNLLRTQEFIQHQDRTDLPPRRMAPIYESTPSMYSFSISKTK